jgi:autotransporter translocation and assembly factor TamB
MASRDVQHLGKLEGVRTGVARKGGAFEADGLDLAAARVSSAPQARSPVFVAVQLGRDVQVVRSDLNVRLTGGPIFTLADRVTAKGQIDLPQGGTLDVKGKTFTIDYGTITFVDDPSNPQIVLRASWQAQDAQKTIVLANFVGPLKTAKLTLDSEPKLPDQQQILSLILYGTTDENTSSNTASSAQGAAAQGVAGNAISGQVNQALGGVNQALEGLGLQSSIATKIDTSQTSPRPEVEVQIARDLSLQVAAVLGVPAPGTNPDHYLFTVGWRFLHHWSLETTRGDQGTSILDVVWQRRY